MEEPTATLPEITLPRSLAMDVANFAQANGYEVADLVAAGLRIRLHEASAKERTKVKRAVRGW